jgi:sugar phosphate isomerase/epimerase
MALLRACQTNTWGPRQGHRFEGILRVSAEAGFEGIEVDARILAGMDRHRLRDQLQAHGLKLAAIHAGDLLAPRTADRAGHLAGILSTLAALEAPLLLCSGRTGWMTRGLATGINTLNRAAAACGEQGQRLLYHHHAFEFDRDAQVMKALLQDTSPEVGICLDVGWLRKAGAPLGTALTDLRPRLGAVHLTDFASIDSSVCDPVDLGTGVVPLTRATAWLRRSRLGDLWVVADQAACSGFPAQCVRRNGAFMIQELGQRGRATRG